VDVGETLFFSYSEHLWIVISDPAKDNGRVLLVNFSSVKPGVPFDPACVLEVGDHPYITQETFVYYRSAQVQSNKDLERQVSSGKIRFPYDPVSPEILKRIREGATKSKFINRGHRKLLEDQGLIP
jgi:hypothetical protein